MRGSYTCSSDYSVYDGVCVHTLTCRTHIFLRTACVLRPSHNFMRVHIHAWLKGAKKVLWTCVTSLDLAFSRLICHPSLLFPHGHFETHPDYDFTDDPVHTFLPYFPVLNKSAGHAPLRTCIAKFGYLAMSDANTIFR